MDAREYLEKMKDPLWYGEQDENGVDLSLIRHNLSLTPEERLLQADRARRSALELMAQAKKNAEEQSKRNRGDSETPR